MRVDIWSDVVCPWCYVGKARFEKALSEPTETFTGAPDHARARRGRRGQGGNQT